MWKSGLQLALGIAYPAIVLLALHLLEPRAVALIALGLAGLRWLTLSAGRAAAFSRTVGPMLLGVAAVFAATALWNDPLGLLLVPTLVSATLLAGFAHSLRSGPPMIERFARLQVETLSDAEVAYCRRVTLVWCTFFVINGGIALALALAGELELWALYSGFLSYLAIGLLFAVEYVYRHWKFRRYVGSVTDPLLSRLFPPHPDAAAQPASPGEVTAATPARRPLRRTLDTSERLPFWPDHFPGEPILPGIVQLRDALAAVHDARRLDDPPSAIERLKFSQPIRPGDRAELSVSPSGKDPSVWLFRIERDGVVASSGRFRFADAGTAPALSAEPRFRPLETSPPIDALVAHRGTMSWLSRVMAHDPTGTLCEVDVAATARFVSPDSTPGRVDAGCALEWMAQCVSAHDNLERRESPGAAPAPRIGFLLGTRRLRIFRPWIDARTRVLVDVAHRWGGSEALAAFECRVYDDAGGLIADARVSCVAPGGDETR